MIKTFSFGKENLGGEKIPAPFDEKNMTTDFLTEFLFDGNAVVSSMYSEDIVGFIYLNGEPYACNAVLSVVDNYVRYNFFTNNFLTSKDIDRLCKMIEEYFVDDDNLEVELVCNEFKDGVNPIYATDPCLLFYRRG